MSKKFVLYTSTIEGTLQLGHKSGQFCNFLVAASDGARFKFSSVFVYLSLRCVRPNLVLHLVLALENTARQRVLEPLQLLLNVRLSPHCGLLTLFYAFVNVPPNLVLHLVL